MAARTPQTIGLRCPYCGDTRPKVSVDSRKANDGSHARRRRECAGCGERFNTIEILEAQVEHYRALETTIKNLRDALARSP